MKKFTIEEKHMTKDRIILYKLGNLEHKVMPTAAAIAKLRDLIKDKPVDGPLELIWGPDLEIEVIDVENAEKYVIEPLEL
jgi:hypothetical protein